MENNTFWPMSRQPSIWKGQRDLAEKYERQALQMRWGGRGRTLTVEPHIIL